MTLHNNTGFKSEGSEDMATRSLEIIGSENRNEKLTQQKQSPGLLKQFYAILHETLTVYLTQVI